MNRWIHHAPLLLLSLAYLLLAGTLSFHFPPVNSDEASYSLHGYNLLHGAGHRNSLYDDVFAPSVYSWRDATPEISHSPFNGWVALWMTVLGKSYWHARLSSVGAGLLVVLVFYMVGCRMGGSLTGALSAGLLVFNPVFLIASSIVRPEMLLLLAESLLFWFVLKARDTFPYKYFLVGLFSGLALGIHHNVGPFLVGLVVYEFLAKGHLFGIKSISQIAAGFFAGLILLLATFDLAKFYFIQKYFFNQFYTPPVISLPWYPWRWLIDLAMSIATGITYYFPTGELLWQRTIHLWTLGVGVGLAALGFSRIDLPGVRDAKLFKIPLLWGGLATFIALAAMVQKKEMLYVTVLFPFLIPGIALFLTDAIKRKTKLFKVQKGAAVGIAVAILTSCLTFTAFSADFVKRCMPYSQIVEKVQAQIGDVENRRVLAPLILWYGWHSPLFRDLGATVKSHWYTGGEKDLRTWLAPWHPDILVVDPFWKHVFLRRGKQPISISEAMGTRVEFLGSVDTGLANGILEIYEIHWPNHS